MNDSDMTMSDDSWFQVLILWNEKKFPLFNVPGDIGLLDRMCFFRLGIT